MAVDCMAMDLVRQGLRTKSQCKKVIGLNQYPHLVLIKLLNACALKTTVKAILIAFIMVSFSSIISTIEEGSKAHDQGHSIDEFANDNPINVDMLPLLFRDLTNEGLLRMRDRVLIVSNGGHNEDLAIYDSLHIIRDSNVDLINRPDTKTKQSVLDQTYEFVFTHDFHADIEFIDRVLKVKGVAVVQVRGDSRASESFKKPSNYEVVYLRQFDSKSGITIIAMRKMSFKEGRKMIPHRRLCGLTSEEKKAAALKKLENVLLEPPRSASGKSNTYSKRTRFLPDLMGDSLESYPRRVFIDVAGDVGWFAKNYPTRNKNFEIYQVETTSMDESSSGNEAAKEIEISEWLRENVKEEEYVVMKAEAEVVEELVNNKAIGLVDELFLECKIKGKKSRRPYWECLALYGMLRDEGVAVHQWWG